MKHRQTIAICLIVSLVSFPMGLVVGFLLSFRIIAYGRQACVNSVLYGSEEQAGEAIDELLREDAIVMTPLLTAFTELGNRPPVPPENKYLIISALAGSELFGMMLGTLASAASLEEDPPLRRRCTEVIKQFVAVPLAGTMRLLARQLHREEDPTIRNEKIALLEMILFCGDGDAEKVEVTDLDAFKERCEDRLRVLRAHSDGTAERIVVY